MRRPIATVLVGPSALLREGLARILGEVDFRVAASAPCVDDGILLAAPQDRPLLLIIDAGDDLRGVVPQVTLFKERRPNGRVVILADHDRPGDLLLAFQAGANAYFIKIAPCNALLKYLELVMLGETILPAKMLSLILDHTDDNQDNHPHGVLVPDARTSPEEYLEADIPDMPRLSDRERSILRYLIEGESNKAIARKIDIAEATVKVHVKAILRKIRVQNRTQAAIWAMSNASYISTISNGSVTSDKPAADPPPLAHTARNGGADRRYKLLNGVVNGDSLTDKIDPPVIAVPRRRDRG
jgi:two-component system, NarL family, nitrate/nitrite response regulator NarL